LVLRRVLFPRQVRYEHVGEYLEWRQQGARGASRNTARLEMKFLGFLMREAIRREFADRNPVEMARIDRDPPKGKPDLDDTAISAARVAFSSRPAWMGIVFEVLIHLGCRFAESSIPWARIDFEARTIQIEDSKRKAGDPRKLFLVPMSDQLAGYLAAVKKKSKIDRTVPVLSRVQNHRWNRVFKSACGATSHSCRVAFISRCHRAGLSESEAMRLVNHSSRLVHAVYTKLSVEDARVSLARVALPPAP
jgi:integrase